MGTQSLAHCGSVTLTFGNGEGEKGLLRKKKKKPTFFQLSCLTNCLASAHSAQRQQPLNLPTT